MRPPLVKNCEQLYSGLDPSIVTDKFYHNRMSNRLVSFRESTCTCTRHQWHGGIGIKTPVNFDADFARFGEHTYPTPVLYVFVLFDQHFVDTEDHACAYM